MIVHLRVLAVVVVMTAGAAWAQDAPDTQSARPAPIERKTPAPDAAKEQEPPAPQFVMPPMANYEKAIFQKTVPSADLVFLKQFEGASSGDLWNDKQFKHVVRNDIPGVMFHFARDMPVGEAMDIAMKPSNVPVQIRDGRYVLVTGVGGIYYGFRPRAFVWVDMQDGIVLAGFFFPPSNGEPTPTLTVFSKQVKEDFISLGQLPPEFAHDLSAWSMQTGVPMVLTRYFIGDVNRKIVLEHDEDFCAPASGNYGPSGSDCEQMDADAADNDMAAAYYMDETGYKTNATAYMLGPDQVDFIRVRERTCGGVLNPLGCRVRLTRERTRVILRKGPVYKPRK